MLFHMNNIPDARATPNYRDKIVKNVCVIQTYLLVKCNLSALPSLQLTGHCGLAQLQAITI